LIKSKEDFSNPEKLGFGCGVIYDGIIGDFFLFEEKDVKKFIQMLLEFDRLVSFNGKKFDIYILKPYCSDEVFSLLLNKEHLDILEVIKNKIGYMVGLNNVAYHTLGIKKTGFGADAPKLLQEGKVKEVLEYCKNDVHITNEIYKKLMRDGKLKIWFSKYGFAEEIDFGDYLLSHLQI